MREPKTFPAAAHHADQNRDQGGDQGFPALSIPWRPGCRRRFSHFIGMHNNKFQGLPSAAFFDWIKPLDPGAIFL